MVKLSEIAAESGFSIPVVSRVLSPNPHKGASVAIKTRKHIQSIAKHMEYRPNRNAEFLKRGKNPVIGCFLPSRVDSLLAQLMKGIGAEAEKQNFPLSFYFDMTHDSYLDFIKKSERYQNCGIITYPYFKMNSEIEAVVDNYQKNGGKIILIESGNSRWQWHNCISVSVDNYHGGKTVADYFLSKNVSLAWTTKYAHIPERVDGFISTMIKAGNPAKIINMDPSKSGIDYSEVINSWIEKICHTLEGGIAGPLGIYIPNDRDAMSMIYRLMERNIKVGKDVLMVGYDGLYLSDLLYPGLTTIAQPFEEVGRQAVKKMINNIYGKETLSTLIEPKLVIRDSA